MKGFFGGVKSRTVNIKARYAAYGASDCEQGGAKQYTDERCCNPYFFVLHFFHVISSLLVLHSLLFIGFCDIVNQSFFILIPIFSCNPGKQAGGQMHDAFSEADTAYDQ